MYCGYDFLCYYFSRKDWNFSVWQRFLGAGMFANDLFRCPQHKHTHTLSLSLSLWKVWELTANGVIMVSAIGNDGPLYGWVHIHVNSLVVPIKWPSHHLPPFSLSPHTINQNPQQPSGHDGRNWSRWNQLWGGSSSFLVSRNDHMGQFKLPPLELPLNPYLDIRTYMVYI